MTDYQRFTVEQEQDLTIIQLEDPMLFDTLMVSELEDELLALLARQAPQKLLVDFRTVSHCSTAVINGLLRAKKRLLAAGGQLGLCGMTDPIRDAYRTLNLDGTVFQIYEDRRQGTAAMR